MSMKCVVCGTSVRPPSKNSAEWHWFTGYLSETVHFCPNHVGTATQKILFDLSKKRPEDWPKKINVQTALRDMRAPVPAPPADAAIESQRSGDGS